MRIKFIAHAWRYGTENTIKVAYNDAVATATRWKYKGIALMDGLEVRNPKLFHTIEYIVGGIIGGKLGFELVLWFSHIDRTLVLDSLKMLFRF